MLDKRREVGERIKGAARDREAGADGLDVKVRGRCNDTMQNGTGCLCSAMTKCECGWSCLCSTMAEC